MKHKKKTFKVQIFPKPFESKISATSEDLAIKESLEQYKKLHPTTEVIGVNVAWVN